MISDNDVNNFLEHYGVKGMKWGIRKDRRAPSQRKQNRETRKKHLGEVKETKAKNKTNEKAALKGVSRKEIKREVGLTRKAQGLT